MKEKGEGKGAVMTGIIAAIAASSCCIPPVIAAIAGVGGISSSLSWIEPFRPYLIGIAVIAIGYAWYVNLKPKKTDDCGCSADKPKWYQTRTFLIAMTIFATISITFPYYSAIFFPDNSKEVVIENKKNLQIIEAGIEGMTCNSCQDHVNYAINDLDGIISVETSYENGKSVIHFDETKTNSEEIQKAINSTGYTVKEIKTIQ